MAVVVLYVPVKKIYTLLKKWKHTQGKWEEKKLEKKHKILWFSTFYDFLGKAEIVN